jgi:hypothetical protein
MESGFGARSARRASARKLGIERVGEPSDDFVLHVEEVGDRFVETVRPQMIAALRVDKLDVDTYPVCRALDTSFEHVAHVELAPDPFQIDRFALVAEGGISPDHPHSAHL